MHLAMEMEESYIPRSLRKIGNICNMPDQQFLRRIIDENLYLIHIQHATVTDKHVLAYCTPRWWRDFFFDPNRSQSFYSTSRISKSVKRPLKVSLTQIIIFTVWPSYPSLRRKYTVTLPLVKFRMPPVCWKALERDLTAMNYWISSDTCPKFVGSMSTSVMLSRKLWLSKSRSGSA